MRNSQREQCVCDPPRGDQYLAHALEPFRSCVERLAQQESSAVSWLEFCRERSVYQQLNKEFVSQLGEALGGTSRGEILEIGAGSGELSRALGHIGLAVRATDPGEWPGIPAADAVERLTARAALRRYQPHTVLLCWPPIDAGLYSSIWRAPSVSNLVTIDPYLDWLVSVPSGWQVIWLEQVNRYSLCRLDYLDGAVQGQVIQHSRAYRVMRATH